VLILEIYWCNWMVSDCADVWHVARHPGKCAASVAAQSRVEPEH